MAAGIFSLPATTSHADQSVASRECRQDDRRLLCLRRFLQGAHCPMERLASVFLSEADTHHLDWRLLPGIAFVESGGGKNYRGNNIFGWGNGNSSFVSVRDGIHIVASRLAHSPFYRGKTVTEKLQTYNADERYPGTVQSVMRKISRTAIAE